MFFKDRKQTATFTIYLADDNTTDRIILESTLRKLGFTVNSFSEGEAILNALRNAVQPVIALLDWMMPDRDGVEICKWLAIHPPQYPVYTIIVTSRTEKSDIAYALDNGANDFVTKPFNVMELRARINGGMRLLEYHQQLLEYTQHVETLADERAKLLVRADRLSTLGILSAGVAHEINNPLSFIAVNIKIFEENCGFLTSVISGTASKEQHERVQTFIPMIPEILVDMKTGVTRINKIITGLKTYVHDTPTKHDYFCVEECIESALCLCANRLKYQVKVHRQYSKLPKVFGDKLQLEQVFINLFTNAADAIEETGVEGLLSIASRLENDHVTITVKDTGKGVPPEMFEKIFLPFFTTKKSGKGTGLGLSISSNILKEHDGDLLVENCPEGGTAFTVVLPVKKGNSV